MATVLRSPEARAWAYSRETATAICAAIAQGQIMEQACRPLGVAPSTVRRWVTADVDGFAAQYAAARTAVAELAMTARAICRTCLQRPPLQGSRRCRSCTSAAYRDQAPRRPIMVAEVRREHRHAWRTVRRRPAIRPDIRARFRAIVAKVDGAVPAIPAVPLDLMPASLGRAAALPGLE